MTSRRKGKGNAAAAGLSALTGEVSFGRLDRDCIGVVDGLRQHGSDDPEWYGGDRAGNKMAAWIGILHVNKSSARERLK